MTGPLPRTWCRRHSSACPATPHRIRDPERAAAYLRSIVINLARDHNRRGLVSLRHRPPAVLDEPSAEETAAASESRAEVVAALRALPRRQRDCVALRYYLDLPVEEIAADPRRLAQLGQDPPAARPAVPGRDLGGEAMSALEDRLARRPRRRGRRVVSPRPTCSPGSSTAIDADRRPPPPAARRRSPRWLAGRRLVTAAVRGTHPERKEGLHMPWWILEVGTNLALLAIALWLGPFIKRFGRAYAADVFHDNPLTGKSYIVLTDIVYYLIFAAYILFTVHVAPQRSWQNAITELVTAEQVTFELGRIGGILLVIGILHGLNIVLMPRARPALLAQPPAARPGQAERHGGRDS